jgi:hypothetical protein
MMRTISSPSSSTIGFATLIFAILVTLACIGRLLQQRDHKGRCGQRQADGFSERGAPGYCVLVGRPGNIRVINSTIEVR